LNLFQSHRNLNSTGSAIVSFALVAPLVMFVSLVLCQLIFLLITYANISIASERGARYISMGSLPSEVISKTTLELEKYNFYSGSPKIEIDKIDISEIKLIEIKISIPIQTFFGMKFYLTSTSHAT
jgi:hypothetical protein